MSYIFTTLLGAYCTITAGRKWGFHISLVTLLSRDMSRVDLKEMTISGNELWKGGK